MRSKEKIVICKPRSGPYPHTRSTGTLVLNISASGTVRNELFFKTSVCGNLIEQPEWANMAFNILFLPITQNHATFLACSFCCPGCLASPWPYYAHSCFMWCSWHGWPSHHLLAWHACYLLWAIFPNYSSFTFLLRIEELICLTYALTLCLTEIASMEFNSALWVTVVIRW